jgi:hypothetical protein
MRWDSGQQKGDIRIDSSACPGLSTDTPVPAQIELGVARAETVRGSLCAVRSCSVSETAPSRGFFATSSQSTRLLSPRGSAEAELAH